MATRFVDIDRDTALLLPPNLRDWVPANHLVRSGGSLRVRRRGQPIAYSPKPQVIERE